MDGGVVGWRREVQADGLATGSKPLVRLGLKAALVKLLTAAGITSTSNASLRHFSKRFILRRLSLELLASPISVASQPAFAQDNRIENSPYLYLTSVAGANNQKNQTNTGEVGTFEEYTNLGVSVELELWVAFDGLKIETTYAIDTRQLSIYTNVSGIDFDNIVGGKVWKQSAFLSGYWYVFIRQTGLQPWLQD